MPMVTRSALPQNYIKESMTLLEDFETIGDWAPNANCTLAADTTNFLTGTKSMTITNKGNGSFYIDKTLSPGIKLDGRSMLYFYCDHPEKLNYISLYFHLGSVWTYITRQAYIYPAVDAVLDLVAGWNVIPIGAWTGMGAATWSDLVTGIEIKGFPIEDQIVSISIDSLYTGGQGNPCCLLMFDDTNTSHYTKAFSYMNAKSPALHGTFYIVTEWIGGSGRLTLAQCQEMYAAGNAIGNHTADHITWTSADLAAVSAATTEATQYILDNEMPRAAYHLSYPGSAGWQSEIQALIPTLGIQSAVFAQTGYLSYPWEHFKTRISLGIHNDTTFATIKAAIDYAIKYGLTLTLMVHDIKDSASTTYEVPTAIFNEMIDYLVAVKMPCLTIDEWSNGLPNPRYLSLPVGRA